MRWLPWRAEVRCSSSSAAESLCTGPHTKCACACVCVHGPVRIMGRFSSIRLILLTPGRAAFVLVKGRHVIQTKALGRSCGLIPLAGPAESLPPFLRFLPLPPFLRFPASPLFQPRLVRIHALHHAGACALKALRALE